MKLIRVYVTIGIALVGASLIAHTPRPLDTRQRDIQLTAIENEIALVFGGSGCPIPSAEGCDLASNNFLPIFMPGAQTEGVYTPENAQPLYSIVPGFSSVKSMPLDESMIQDVYLMNKAITDSVDAGNTVGVFGYSQSSMAASIEMSDLAKAGVPADAVKFMLVGDVDNPDGGLSGRFDMTFPALRATFDVNTPADTPYDTSIYTLEYDGFADFPKYPMNILSDINAVIGLDVIHDLYPTISPSQIATAIALSPTTGYDGDTSYYVIPLQPDLPEQSLPLLLPLHALPVIGKPLADLLQPVLTQIVNLGYDNPQNQGWDVGQPNVTTGFGLFPSAEQFGVALKNMGPAIQQGIQAFAHDLKGGASNAPDSTPDITTTPIGDPLAPSGHLLDDLTNVTAQIYSLVLPIMDTVPTDLVTIPANVAQTFVANLHDGPVDALGMAVGKADALYTFATGIDIFTIAGVIVGAIDPSALA